MKIAVLLSGGVDSSVALKLLKDAGHDVTAFYLKIWLEDELSYLGECPWQEDLSYAQNVCSQLSVPLNIVSLQKEYHDQVVQYAIEEIRQGRTPNPDMLCNSRIKFGMFFDHIDDSFEKVATGHYAQIATVNGYYAIACAPDPIKDQSYFLSHLSQDQLKRALFPIGHLQKHEVRALAQKFDLSTKARKDSQGICFLGKLKFRDFVKHYCGEKEGAIIELETGARIGTHQGFWFYTIGQRQGIGLGGGPWYVVRKDPERNSIYVSRDYYSNDKDRTIFSVHGCNWFVPQSKVTKKMQVKLRHGEQFHEAYVTPTELGAQITLVNRDQGIAPGQFAVFYEHGICLGGGIIQQAFD